MRERTISFPSPSLGPSIFDGCAGTCGGASAGPSLTQVLFDTFVQLSQRVVKLFNVCVIKCAPGRFY